MKRNKQLCLALHGTNIGVVGNKIWNYLVNRD